MVKSEPHREMGKRAKNKLTGRYAVQSENPRAKKTTSQGQFLHLFTGNLWWRCGGRAGREASAPLKELSSKLTAEGMRCNHCGHGWPPDVE